MSQDQGNISLGVIATTPNFVGPQDKNSFSAGLANLPGQRQEERKL